MANLPVTAQGHASLQTWTIEIDGDLAVVYPATQGSASVAGICGDGSQHRADYSFNGPAGATFSFKIKCGNRIVASVATSVPAATAPNAADFVEFTI